MSHVTARVMADVAGRGAQVFGLADAAVQGFFGALEDQRVEELDAVSALVAELGKARRQAAAAIAESERLRAEASRLRADLRSCGGALAVERARADRLDGSLRRLIGAVHADRATRAAAA